MKKINYKIIIDTREKNIDHIIKAFEKNNVKYEKTMWRGTLFFSFCFERRCYIN